MPEAEGLQRDVQLVTECWTLRCVQRCAREERILRGVM